MFDILYTFYYVLLCQIKLKKLGICPKLGGSIFFFSWPQAGLTNQDHVRHYDTRVPLAKVVIGAIVHVRLRTS